MGRREAAGQPCPESGPGSAAPGSPGVAAAAIACWNDPVVDEFLDLESSLSEVAVELFGAGTVPGTLQRIVDLAATTVDGCDAAGIMVVDADVPSTVASTDAFVKDL